MNENQAYWRKRVGEKQLFGKWVRKRILKKYLHNRHIFSYFLLHCTPSSKVTYSTRKQSAKKLAEPLWTVFWNIPCGVFWKLLFPKCTGIVWIVLVQPCRDVLISVLTKLLPTESYKSSRTLELLVLSPFSHSSCASADFIKHTA